MRQVALVVTAGYTAYQPYFRLVVEPHGVQRLGQSERVSSLLYMQDAFSLKLMSCLEHLQTARLPFRYKQFEIAVYPRCQRVIAAPHRVAVQQEHSTCYGNSGVLIQHSSRQSNRSRVHKVNTRSHGVVRRKRYTGGTGTGVIEREHTILMGRNNAVVSSMRDRYNTIH